jgi:hypothetical protein
LAPRASRRVVVVASMRRVATYAGASRAAEDSARPPRRSVSCAAEVVLAHHPLHNQPASSEAEAVSARHPLHNQPVSFAAGVMAAADSTHRVRRKVAVEARPRVVTVAEATMAGAAITAADSGGS